MDRATLARLWSEFWDRGLFAAPWELAVDVSAAQAAWSPAPGRKSIWQNVNHVIFWRTYVVHRLRGGANKSEAEINAANWAVPDPPTESAWARARKDLEASHRLIEAAVADPALGTERLEYLLAHDAYHLGQIMYIRALQGMPPIE